MGGCGDVFCGCGCVVRVAAGQSDVEILPGRSTKDVRNPPSESSGCGHGSNTPSTAYLQDPSGLVIAMKSSALAARDTMN